MKRLTVLFGDSNVRLIKVMDEIAKDPYWSEQLIKPDMREFPEMDSYREPMTQHDRRVWTSAMVEGSKHCPQVICTQDEVIFLTIRAAVHQNMITPEEVELRWYAGSDEPVILPLDKDGRLNVWPPGFFTTMDQLLDILLSPKP